MRWSRLFLAAAIAVAVGSCQRAEQSSLPEGVGQAAERPANRAPAAPSPGMIRRPAVAGMFYPGDREELGKMVDGFLAAAKPEPIGALRGLIVPHAGYSYSGATAAFGYKLLQGREFRTVILMGPSHYADFQGAYLGAADAYATPLGVVRLSPLVAELRKAAPFAARGWRVQRPPWSSRSGGQAAEEDTPDAWEHSLEVQLPFLQRTLEDFSLVPIVFGRVDPQAVARVLAGHLDGKTLLVASSDLSHYYPDQTARRMDGNCTEAICRMDTEWMARQEACGKLPILTLMHLARQKGWKPKLLRYTNSGDTTGDKSAVVGYAAVAFFEPDAKKADEPPAAASLAPGERQFLLDLARKTLVEVAGGGSRPRVDPAQVPKAVARPAGCFVTLTKQGNLRGCIGHLFPQEPLYAAVIDNAAAAAVEDPRFLPVRREELDEIAIEISVLSIPQPLVFRSPEDLLAKLRPKIDGVVLRVGQHQSTYLPQVWEQIPEKEEFMNHLAEKAGLEASAWKGPRAIVLTYQVEAFHEQEAAKKAGRWFRSRHFLTPQPSPPRGEGSVELAAKR